MMDGELYADFIDAADGIEVYRKGKTFECPECGQGFGFKKSRVTWKCPTCGEQYYDSKADEREDQDFIKVVEDDQYTFEAFN